MESDPSKMEPVEFALKIHPILELEEFEKVGRFSWRYGFSVRLFLKVGLFGKHPEASTPDSRFGP